MQTHFRKSCVKDGEFDVDPCSPTFATIEIGDLILYVQGPDDADRLIRAVVAAKDGMLGFAAAQRGEDAEPGPYDAAIQQARVWAGHVTGGCMAVSETGTGCTSEHEAHPLPHRDVNGFEWPGGEDEDAPGQQAEAEVTIATATEASTADALPAGAPGQCTAHGTHGTRGLYCWRPDGHDGWHYDSVDKLAWRPAVTEASRA